MIYAMICGEWPFSIRHTTRQNANFVTTWGLGCGRSNKDLVPERHREALGYLVGWVTCKPLAVKLTAACRSFPL